MRDCTEFDVWKLCDEVRRRVRIVVAHPGLRAASTLRSQLSDAAEGTCPALAEGFSRYHPRDHGGFVRVAKASLSEVITHLQAGADRGLVDATESAEICTLGRRARGAATGLIRYLETAEAPHVPRTRPKGRQRKR